MDAVLLPETAMQPILLSARQYDSRQFLPPSCTRTAERVTKSYEFSFYCSDVGSVIIDGKSYPIRSGAWRFQPPNVKICSVPPFVCQTVHFTLNGSDALPSTPIANEFLSQLPPYFESRMPQRYADAIEDVLRASFEVGTGASVKKAAALYALLALLHEDVTTPEQNSVVRRAEDYLKAHFAEALSLDELGILVGYHPLYFQRMFKAKTGKSPHEYLTDLRMTHARRLLITTRMAVRAVAASCGYPSVSHFNAVFKRQCGESPLAFRRRNTLPV